MTSKSTGPKANSEPAHWPFLDGKTTWRVNGGSKLFRSLKLSSSRSTWTNSRLPRRPMRDSRGRRSVPNYSGNSHPCNGAAWFKAPGFRSKI